MPLDLYDDTNTWLCIIKLVKKFLDGVIQIKKYNCMYPLVISLYIPVAYANTLRSTYKLMWEMGVGVDLRWIP